MINYEEIRENINNSLDMILSGLYEKEGIKVGDIDVEHEVIYKDIVNSATKLFIELISGNRGSDNPPAVDNSSEPIVNDTILQKKSRKDVEQLKLNWLNDPIWDLEETDGFEEFSEELLRFRLMMEKKWEKIAKERELQIDEEAEKLGVKGIYRLLLEQKNKLNRHESAIESLADGNTLLAYHKLQGIE